jgi:AMMECR1 domain-containing protein/aromatic ring-opening dioxygenase LigB subunit
MSTLVSSEEIVFTALMPHAPILATGVGSPRQHKEVRHTIDAMCKVVRHALEAQPDMILLISPHSPRRSGAFGIWRMPVLRGSLELFGAPDCRVELPLDTVFADRLSEEASHRGLHLWSINSPALDYGATVPLSYFAAAGWQGPTVVVGLNKTGEPGLEEFGEAIAAAATGLKRRVAVIASGDMSHRIGPSAPLGFNVEGNRFDESLIELLRHGGRQGIRELDPKLLTIAAEDVVDSVRVALAASSYSAERGSVLSYEGPFGVGYGVAILSERNPAKLAASGISRIERSPGSISHFADLPALARMSIEAQLEGGDDQPPMKAAGALVESRGVFVTLRTVSSRLRGCAGTASPTATDLVHETWHCARAAAFADSRFPALKKEDLRRVRVTISILSALEPVTSLSELDPVQYGIQVTADDGRAGLLLPALAGVDTAAEQVRLARHKGSIAEHEHVRIERFTTRVYQEPPPASDERG